MDPAMTPTLTAADLDRLGDEIATLSAHLDAATARLLALLREFDARGGWANGCRSCAEWLSWRVGLDPGAARERVRVVRALGELPQLAAALARGELSYSKVRALTRVATPDTETRLLEVGRAGTAAHVERIVRAWRRVDRQVEAQQTAARHRNRSLQVYPDEDGMMVVRGRLEPEAGAMLVRALEAAREALYARRRATAAESAEAEPPSHGQQQADALTLVAETALQHRLGPCPGSERYQVVVHVDAAVLADPAQPGQSAFEEGVHVSAEMSRRLGCDATRVVMRNAGDGQVLDIGRRSRTISPALRRALQARDRGCRFPGCGVRHAQGHHIHHWANGGPTRLDNLALLCWRHHRAVHEEGYRVERDAGGTLRFSTPRSRPIPEVPAPAAVPPDPTQALVTAHRVRGLAIDARTGCPSWLGERLDLAWAIDVLHPAANPVAGPVGRSPLTNRLPTLPQTSGSGPEDTEEPEDQLGERERQRQPDELESDQGRDARSMPSVRTSGGANPQRKKSERPLDLIDPERDDWETGDCVLRIDLLDAPKHEAVPRSPLAPALELYRLSRDRRPEPADARLLWDIGQAVDAYVTRLFDAGILCPFSNRPKDEAPDRSSS